MRIRRTAAALSFLLITAGCFEIEQSIVLEQDLSGRAGVRIGVDLEPLVLIMTQMKREMEGKEGPPTDAELQEARKAFASQSRSKTPTPAEQPEIELPEGIELLELDVQENDLNVVTNFLFQFDRVDRLSDLRLPSGGDDPARTNVVETPFGGLEVVEDGELITIRTHAQNPASSAKGQAKSSITIDKETEKMMEKAFENLRLAYRITLPFEVVSHNATRVEKDTLIWEFDYEAFKRMEASKQLPDLDVQVTFRR